MRHFEKYKCIMKGMMTVRRKSV